ncbi:MAG TPA: flagellin [Micropepsaceae bacterium]|jgi:flagellar hook-associated protein 3 FlgL|nr:flagellin [Micropepsaceae bacterium]
MSIDRIGTAANAQLMLSQIQKSEVTLNKDNEQVVTGKVADTYSGYGDKVAVMEAARSASAHADANVAAAQQASSRLDLQDTQLTQLGQLADQVRQALTKASADQDATSLMSQMQGFFSQATDILNAKDANGYIFAGDNNQVPPVSISNLSDLAALGSPSAAFNNGSLKATMRVGDNQTVQVGVLASDAGTQLFSLFQQIAQFDAGNTFDTKTNAAQQSFLESTVQTAANVSDGVNQQTATNGINYQMVQNTVTRLQATSGVYKGFVSNIEDVDITTALSKLNQDQISLQASFQLTSQLNKMSLLDFMQ